MQTICQLFRACPVAPAPLPILALVGLLSLLPGSPAPLAAQPPAEAPAEAPVDVHAAPPELDLLNARHPFPGVLTLGQPSEEQLEALAEAGYRTVVNLRTPGEHPVSDREPELVPALGMRYLALPVNMGEGLTRDNALKLQEILAERDNYPVAIHCGSSNRVGALFALKTYLLDDATVEEALQVGRSAGLTRMEPVAREKIEAVEEKP